jgi:hypothetical protein
MQAIIFPGYSFWQGRCARILPDASKDIPRLSVFSQPMFFDTDTKIS